MYTRYFRLKELPFQLLPNPVFLFLSRNHEEALAHLTYAASYGDGFVEITGEVGTGKTTLCRAFLENLDDTVQAAYIFNPRLDTVQLLQTVCDEFGISSEADNTKDLIDILNLFLMEKKREGQSVILIIDEAQNLSRGVLEQLRMISNLETTTSKLIQIILVGQPELGEMLDSFELRQLRQRINLCCHLLPLSYPEMKRYIRHRMRTASQGGGEVIFTTSALGRIYRYSGGVPRMINIACDRALLTAYGVNLKTINSSVAARAIKELAARGGRVPHRLFPGKTALYVCMGFCLVCTAFFLFPMLNSDGLKNFPLSRITAHRSGPGYPWSGDIPEKSEIPGKPEGVRTQSLTSSPHGLEDVVTGLTKEPSRRSSMALLALLWGEGDGSYPGGSGKPPSFARYFSRVHNMKVQRIRGSLQMLARLNLPAILELHPLDQGEPVYLVLVSLDDSRVMLKSGVGRDGVRVTYTELQARWRGVAYLPWKDFFKFTGNISGGATRGDLILLKQMLGRLGFDGLDPAPRYDGATRAVVEEIQAENGILVDGVVGSMTKIILYNQMAGLTIPHIGRKGRGDGLPGSDAKRGEGY